MTTKCSISLWVSSLLGSRSCSTWAYRGCWLDYQWRLQSMANTPMASIAPLKSCRSCTNEFESVYRPHRMCLPGGARATCVRQQPCRRNPVVFARYGVEASLGGVSDRAKRAACAVRICSCLLVLLGFGAGFFFGTRLFSKFTRGSSKTERDSSNVCLTADPEFSLGHQEDDPLLSAQEGCKGRW